MKSYTALALLLLAATSFAQDCGEDQVADCADDDCCPASWLADDLCDGTDQEWGCDLSCYAEEFGDCGYVTCGDDEIPDCADDGDCCPASWLDDELCDGEDQMWGCDLTCYDEEFMDCNPCGEGEVLDCADDDCCPEHWIADGLCDGEDQ